MIDTRFRSDPALIEEVRTFGRFNTNACLQCGSCTLSCDLTSDSASFPRKTLRFVLLGLTKPLQRSLEPWLCYYCGDCSTGCPMEADPGEGMMTLRRYLAAQYDLTGLSSKILTSTAWHVTALLLAGIAVLLMILLHHLYVVGLDVSDLASQAGSVGIEHMFGGITLATRIVLLLPVLLLSISAARMYWLTMHQGGIHRIPLRPYLEEIRTFISHALVQRRLRDCTEPNRWILHFALVLGCISMLIVLFFGLAWFQTDSIRPIYDPQRWVGYLITAAILYPVMEILVGRTRGLRHLHRFSEFSDWILPILLALTTLSGIVLHTLRYLGQASAAHYLYIAHLIIAVPMLVIEIPFGKWSHVLYRPLAIYFQKVRERAMTQESTIEAAAEHAA